MVRAVARLRGIPLQVAGTVSTRWLGQLVVLAIALALVGTGLLASIGLGAVSLGPAQVIQALLDRSTVIPRQIVWNLRVPRALVGALVGMNLGVSGVLLQGIMRNSLASPTIIGVTAGAGLAATVVMLMVPGLPTFLPLAAFAGAMGAAVLVYLLSWQPGVGTSPVRMVLAGVAITSMLTAFTTFLMVTFSDRVQPVVLWMAGNLIGRSWGHLRLIWPYSVGGLAIAFLLIRQLNVLQLGDETAQGLGVRIELARLLAMAAASFLAASAVSVAGLVGFIGLMVPHTMRLLGGYNHAYLIPAAAIGGAALMMWADLGARMLLAPAELPVGIITAVMGGPYFVYLLYRTRLLR
ncbi:MAG: FecCD family ABC transporter permease [Anaerolineae bacterium]